MYVAAFGDWAAATAENNTNTAVTVHNVRFMFSPRWICAVCYQIRSDVGITRRMLERLLQKALWL